MNIQRYVLSFGSAAVLAALITGCSKSTSTEAAKSSASSIVAPSSIATTPSVTYDGGYNPAAPVVESTTIDGITLDAKKDPKLADFLKTYADYGYEKGQIFGAPKKSMLGNLIRTFTFDKSAGSYIEFKAKDPEDKHFHAITQISGSDKTFAVWGVIGDEFKKSHHAWGFPTGFETSEIINGQKVYSQEFQHGTVTWSGKGEPKFTKK